MHPAEPFRRIDRFRQLVKRKRRGVCGDDRTLGSVVIDTLERGQLRLPDFRYCFDDEVDVLDGPFERCRVPDPFGDRHRVVKPVRVGSLERRSDGSYPIACRGERRVVDIEHSHRTAARRRERDVAAHRSGADCRQLADQWRPFHRLLHVVSHV